jgi:hypothetical protein
MLPTLTPPLENVPNEVNGHSTGNSSRSVNTVKPPAASTIGTYTWSTPSTNNPMSPPLPDPARQN